MLSSTRCHISFDKMQSRNMLNKSVDATLIEKMARTGHHPVPQSELRDIDSSFIACNLFSMEKTSPRRDTYRSIYSHHNDTAMMSWLSQRTDQIESIDHGKLSTNYKLLGARNNRDTKCLQFSYEKPMSEIIGDFENNRQGFYSKIIRNRGYKIKNVKEVLEHKGLIKIKKY